MVIDEGALGGQAATTEALENYPGFPEGIKGSEWAERVVEQAKRFGVEFLRAQTVTGLRRAESGLWVTTGDGMEYGSCAVLIATGADYRRLGVEGEEDFIGAEEILRPDGLFVFIGQRPNTALLKDSGLSLDDHGFILTGHALTHHPTWPTGQEPPDKARIPPGSIERSPSGYAGPETAAGRSHPANPPSAGGWPTGESDPNPSTPCRISRACSP